MRAIESVFGNGKYVVKARAVFCGNDISVTVVGGTRHHIGAVALAVYEPERNSATLSAISVYTHRDDRVASHFAKEISRQAKCTVSASAGIHVDDAAEEDISILWHNSLECCALLIEKLKNLEEA